MSRRTPPVQRPDPVGGDGWQTKGARAASPSPEIAMFRAPMRSHSGGPKLTDVIMTISALGALSGIPLSIRFSGGAAGCCWGIFGWADASPTPNRSTRAAVMVFFIRILPIAYALEAAGVSHVCRSQTSGHSPFALLDGIRLSVDARRIGGMRGTGEGWVTRGGPEHAGT